MFLRFAARVVFQQIGSQVGNGVVRLLPTELLHALHQEGHHRVIQILHTAKFFQAQPGARLPDAHRIEHWLQAWLRAACLRATRELLECIDQKSLQAGSFGVLFSTQNFQVGMLTWRAGMALVLTSVCTFEATSSAFLAASGLGNTGAGFFDVAAAAGVVSMSAAPCASSAVILMYCITLEMNSTFRQAVGVARCLHHTLGFSGCFYRCGRPDICLKWGSEADSELSRVDILSQPLAT